MVSCGLKTRGHNKGDSGWQIDAQQRTIRIYHVKGQYWMTVQVMRAVYTSCLE